MRRRSHPYHYSHKINYGEQTIAMLNLSLVTYFKLFTLIFSNFVICNQQLFTFIRGARARSSLQIYIILTNYSFKTGSIMASALGKTALVTGSSRGLGFGIVSSLLKSPGVSCIPFTSTPRRVHPHLLFVFKKTRTRCIFSNHMHPCYYKCRLNI